MAASLFRPGFLDVVVERFPDDDAFPPPDPGDAIAGLFHLALEMIARTGRSLALAGPGRRAALAVASDAARVADVDLLARLQALIGGNAPERFVEEDAAFLRILRAQYRACVRGQRAECWEELLRSAAGNGDGGGCARTTACLDAGPGPERPRADTCASFRAAWRRTSLGVAPPGPASPEELGSRILASWPALGMAADRDALPRILAARLSPSPGAGPRERSVRGLTVRLCSDLVEECLGELSRRLLLPAERGFSLLA